MRPSIWLPLLLPLTAAIALSACKGDTKTLNPIVPADKRNAPITPGTRDALTRQAGNLQGSNCSPNATGPAVCTSTNPDCTATFDANGDLTHLHCSVDTYTFDCTRPCSDIFECVWSDRPNCADLYNGSGVFEHWACDQNLANYLACEASDGGSGPDTGTGTGCHGLDEQTCSATPGCIAHHCPGCNGQQTYAGCGTPNEPTACPAITCPACQGLDEHACMANPNCSAGYCPACGGGQTYAGCFLPNQPHDCAQPPPNCHTCQGLSETACMADASCHPLYCDQCGNHNYVGCGDPNTPPPSCPAIPCPACVGLDEQSCTANAGCHAVYNDPGTCGCAPVGCCIHFDHCALGQHAECAPPQGSMCTGGGAPLACEGENGFVVAYMSNGCTDGCVHALECGGSPAYCAGAQGTMFPTFNHACTTDPDCYVAIHQTDCCGSMRAMGIDVNQQAQFRNDEAICESEYPGCGCASRGILADDGQTTLDSSRVHARCQAQPAGGSQCMTFIQ